MMHSSKPTAWRQPQPILQAAEAFDRIGAFLEMITIGVVPVCVCVQLFPGW